MGVGAFGRDLQVVDDGIAALERGWSGEAPVAKAVLLSWSERMSRWQWVIHGDTARYRRALTDALWEEGRWKMAKRVALCGRSDAFYTELGGKGVKVKPGRCGCRACPRCSRAYGWRYVRRVSAHLAARPHGELWHFVLTQRNRRGCALLEVKEKFDRSWSRFYRTLAGQGMIAGLATYHVKWTKQEAWHYHLHLIVEFPSGVCSAAVMEGLQESWWKAKGEDEVGRTPFFARRVVDAGPAFSGLDGQSQGEFWRESGDAAERALQYCVRDVVQGVETWCSETASGREMAQFISVIRHVKLHRCYGAWRRAVADEADEESVTERPAEGKSGSDRVWIRLGSVDGVLMRAEAGEGQCREAVLSLLSTLSGRSYVSDRLLKATARIAA